MSPTLNDILNLLNEIAPFSHMAGWDNAGLQVGDLSKEIHRIFFALDPTMDNLMNASEKNAQLLLTHHPLIFKSLSQINYHAYPGSVIVAAIKNDIAVIAVHTNLDVAWGGINDMLADLLELDHPEILDIEDSSENHSVGLGRIGSLKEPTSLTAFIDLAKRVLGCKVVRVLGNDDLVVKRIAVVGGSGGSLIARASEKGADLLVTGDIGHHEALEAESLNLALMDAGHFFTEKAAIRLFADRFKEKLSAKGWGVVVEIDHDEKAPMREQ
ncbi:MAG: Nif3-like dinuclear metal center hexameric protein [Deltaproteobacteria bacterium]|nr:Nif3-like dinuclear metal center hexameric protein [Deltaproteobacteria bacterium]